MSRKESGNNNSNNKELGILKYLLKAQRNKAQDFCKKLRVVQLPPALSK